MKNAFIKNTLREISKSKSRFLSVFAISLIGVAFFAGVKASGPDMRFSSDKYYDDANLMDLRIVSTMGLTDKDVDVLNAVDGVSGVFPSRYTDIIAATDGSETVARAFSYSADSAVNKITVAEGRLPQAANECIIDTNPLKAPREIGEKITFRSGDSESELSDTLSCTEYTIVGKFSSPMYISSTQRGSTTIGDGTINMLIYIPEENFVTDYYTEIYVTFDNLKPLSCYEEEYISTRDEWTELIETLGVERSEERREEVLEEPLKELADGEKELADAKAEGEEKLADAEKELADAKVKLDDAKQELADGRTELEDGKVQLADGEKQLSDARKELADAEKELSDAKAQLDDAQMQLADGKAQLDDGKKQLDDAKQMLADSREQLDSGREQFDASKTEFEQKISDAEKLLADNRAKYEDGEKQYADGLSQYNAGLAEYETGKATLDAAKIQLDAAIALYGEDNPLVAEKITEYNAGLEKLDSGKKTLDAGKALLDASRAQLDSAKTQLEAGETELAQQRELGQTQLYEAEKTLDDGEKQYADGLNQYNENLALFTEKQQEYLDGYNEYLDGKAKYEDGLKQYNDGLADYTSGAAELEVNRQKLIDAEKTLTDGEKEYEDGLKEYNDGLAEFNDKKAEFDKEIADAEKKIADGRKEIDDIGEAKWYVFTRDDNPAYTEYGANADRIINIGKLFPVFFILVAALVCLTTMTRMVEENRTQIGTLKAIGYKDGAIMAHYMFYALTATFFGSAAGLVIGPFLFPEVIFYAYGMMYKIPTLYRPVQADLIIYSLLIMLACIGLTVFFSCRAELAQRPSQLMRPKAPKSGKRIFLEKVGFIWNKLSFFHRVSARNLFLYKRRMLMTVIGIAGCTALTLTGFGLRDSISDIVNKQFNEIYTYSGIAAVDDVGEAEFEGIEKNIESFDGTIEHIRAYQKKFTMSNGSESATASLVVPDGSLADYIVMRDRLSRDSVEMTDEGAVITEKLAKLLKLKTGDEITVELDEAHQVKVKITAITEHYASHFVYLTSSCYERVFEEAAKYNMIYMRGDNLTDESRSELSETLLKNENVLLVSMNSSIGSTFEDMLSMLDLVIIVLIVSAGALAFVVLYNLTNINITERIREIATLKVLGFYDKEVSGYVFRENVILTVIGGLAGLLLGRLLCDFVITAAEIDEVMFGRDVSLLSYIISFAVTLVFAVIVNLFMHFHLRKVSMVESLKSVE